MSSFSVYVVGVVKQPPVDFADEVIGLLLWLRDRLNQGVWGTFADVVLDPSIPNDLAALPPVDPRIVPETAVSEQVRRGYTDEQVARIREHLARGELRVLNVGLDGLSFKYHRVAADYHLVQLHLPELFDGERRGDPLRFEAVFELESPMVHRVFVDLHAHFGFVGVLPEGRGPETMFSWPPSGHWRDHLSAELASVLGGALQIQSALPDHLVIPDPSGVVGVVLPLGPEQAGSTEAARLQDQFAAFMAANLPSQM